MPFGTITSTSNTFGSISGDVGANVPGTLTGSVGVPGPQGIQGPVGPQGPQGVPGVGGAWGSIVGTLSAQGDLWTALSSKYDASNPNGFITSTALVPYITSATAASTYQPLSGMTAYLTTASAASTYAPIAAGLPTGGTVGQVLVKNSGTAYDATFQTLIPGDRYVTTSTSSLTVSNGIKNLTIGTGLAYTPNQDVTISLTSDPTLHHMHGQVTAYNSGTGAMTVDVQNHTGSGTYSAWTVNVGGIVPLQTVEWGEVLGNLGDQTDLATALGNKLETSDAASTYQTIAGMSSYLTTADAATTYYLNTNPDAFITASALTGYATESFVTSQGYITSAALSGYATESWVTSQGYLTSAPVTSVAGKTGAVSLVVGDVSGAAALSGATFTGLVGTPASTTTTAGLNIPHGAAPTTPVNGDLWTTTGGLFWRQNGSTQQAVDVGSTQTISGNKTFSNANVSLGTSTGAGTINVGTGATISGSTKTINIGTGGVSGSTTNINLGTTSGGGATITLQNNTTVGGTLTVNGASLSLGTSTAAGTIGIGTGATVSGSTRTINIGTASAAGSTNAIVIGGGSGTSTTTLQGTTNGVTVAADTNSTALATTAFVVGQAGSATPLVDGTAAVGTSLRYARQDHVHPTDTSRAALAGATFTGLVSTPASAGGGAGFRINHGAAPTVPANGDVWTTASGFFVNLNGTTNQMAAVNNPTFTGVPAAPTAAVDTNTTQLATTAFVVAQAGSATPLVNGTAAVGTSLRYARQDHVHPTDTTRAPLASPAFTGTPSLPTGTTAVTQSAGNNTTAVATTAFVTAAVPAFATTAEINSPSVTNKVVSPWDVVRMITNRAVFETQASSPVFASSGAGAEAYKQSNDRQLGIGTPNVGVGGYGQVIYETTTAAWGVLGAKRGAVMQTQDWSKRIWMTGCTCFLSMGDANTVGRLMLGGRTSATTGSPTKQSIGWRVNGGGGNPLVLVTYGWNGSALVVTETTSSFIPVANQTFDWMIYNEPNPANPATSFCYLYVNDTLVATGINAPADATVSSNYYVQSCEATASQATRMNAFILPSKIWWSR